MIQFWYARFLPPIEMDFAMGRFLGLTGNKDNPHYMLPYIWMSMKRRCENNTHKHWKHYGKRGIAVCERWQTFKNFYEDMSPTYFPSASLERADIDGNYNPSNCSWIDKRRQADNRNDSIKLVFRGKVKNLHVLAREFGITKGTAFYRFHNGWSIEQLLGLTPRPKRSNKPAIRKSPRHQEIYGENGRSAGSR